MKSIFGSATLERKGGTRMDFLFHSCKAGFFYEDCGKGDIIEERGKHSVGVSTC